MWRKRDVLLLVAVDGKSGPAILTKVLGDIVRNPLSADEDEDLGVFLAYLIQMLDELRPLFKVAADFDNLLDVVVGGKLSRANVDLDKILQEVLQGKL